MQKYQPGTILLVENVPDPNGTNHKNRNIVLVIEASSDEDEFIGVCITGTFNYPLKENMVKMPFSKTNACKCHSGLVKDCVAMCDWLHYFSKKEIIEKTGFLRADYFKPIIAWLANNGFKL
jgi:hypothetical protein